ncbi:unnamed protein product, partial [marine sediment metagenome]
HRFKKPKEKNIIVNVPAVKKEDISTRESMISDLSGRAEKLDKVGATKEADVVRKQIVLQEKMLIGMKKAQKIESKIASAKEEILKKQNELVKTQNSMKLKKEKGIDVGKDMQEEKVLKAILKELSKG